MKNITLFRWLAFSFWVAGGAIWVWQTWKAFHGVVDPFFMRCAYVMGCGSIFLWLSDAAAGGKR